MCPVTIKAANSGRFWLNNWRMKTLNGESIFPQSTSSHLQLPLKATRTTWALILSHHPHPCATTRVLWAKCQKKWVYLTNKWMKIWKWVTPHAGKMPYKKQPSFHIILFTFPSGGGDKNHAFSFWLALSPQSMRVSILQSYPVASVTFQPLLKWILIIFQHPFITRRVSSLLRYLEAPDMGTI